MRKLTPQLWGLGQLPLPTVEHTAETVVNLPPDVLAWAVNESLHIAAGSKLAIAALQALPEIGQPAKDEKREDYVARTRAAAQAAWPALAAKGLDYTSAEATAILADRAKPTEAKKAEAVKAVEAERDRLAAELAELKAQLAKKGK